jgi:hypothetical protein
VEHNHEKTRNKKSRDTVPFARITFETTLQRHNTENLKQIFPEKELSGVSPNFHIRVSVSNLR